jgi:hypothetical protein
VRELQIRVGGRWLSVEALYGDVTMSTVWPGGSDELTWSMGSRPLRKFRGRELVQAYHGPVCVWCGVLNEPDPSQDQQAARGLWRRGDDFYALDGSGNATTTPDTAVDQAITRGLEWTRPASISSSAVDYDITQGPVSLSTLLDAWAIANGQRWWVTPAGELLGVADDTAPTWQTFPLDTGLGYALDHYASTLVGRYQTSTGYATSIRTNTAAETDHGHQEQDVDLTPRGVLTATKANTVLDNLLALGAAVPAYTTGIDAAYGEVLTRGGTPVAPELVYSGPLVRVHGGVDLAQRKNSALYLDVQVGRTQLADGVLTISPMQLTGDTLLDQLTAAVTRRKGA